MDKKIKRAVSASGILAIAVFILLMLISLPVQMLSLVPDGEPRTAFAILHFAYAILILSFLGGAHWNEGIRQQNAARIIFPVRIFFIASLVFLFFGIYKKVGIGYLFLAGLYFLFYYKEKRCFSISGLPDFAQKIRKQTYITGAITLFLSFLIYYFFWPVLFVLTSR